MASVLRYFRWRNLLPTHNTKTITTIIAIIIGRIQLHIYGSLRVDILHNYFRSIFVSVNEVVNAIYILFLSPNTDVYI